MKKVFFGNMTPRTLDPTHKYQRCEGNSC